MSCQRSTMSFSGILLGSAVFVLTVCGGCGAPSGDNLPSQMVDCGSDHGSVGAVASLETHFHDVAGTATVVDDCTIEISDFTFDGQGIDVRVVVSSDSGFGDFDILTDDLRADGPYDGVQLTVPLREGTTLDDFDRLSIWCVPAGASFGDGVFEMPAR